MRGFILIATALKDVKRRTKIIILAATVGFILITPAHFAFIDGRFDSRQKSPTTQLQRSWKYKTGIRTEEPTCTSLRTVL